MTRPRPATLLILFAALVVSLLAVRPLNAQTTPTLQFVQVDVWPEYDRPAALVFFIGQTTADTPGPVDLTFQLPETATIHAVAYAASNTQLANTTYSIDGSRLTLTSPNGTFHVEFYDSALTFNGNLRAYSLRWLSDYDVQALAWQVQQPAQANNLVTDPTLTSLLHDDFGLTTYRIEVGAVDAGQPADLKVNYDKPTHDLTADLLQTSGGTPTPSNDRPLLPTSVFLVVIGVIIAALAATAGYFYAQARRHTPAPAAAEAAPAVHLTGSRDGESQAAADGLTEREIEVLKLVSQGLMNEEVGDRLAISPNTVARHRENMMKKLDLHSRTELVMYAVRIGLVEMDE